jgi:hypothetical protein
MALPKLTPEQSAAALDRARQVRAARSALRGRLKRGEIGLAAVLEDAATDGVIAKTKVSALIESLPGVGKVSARQAMERHGIAGTRRVAGLGPRQREALLQEFS